MAEKTEDEIETKNLNLYQKLAAISGEIGTIAKDGQNREQNYKFIEYAAVAGVLRSLFAKYNIMVFPTMGERTETEVKTSSGKIGYHVLIDFTFTFINSDKPDEKHEVHWIGEATDYGDKATNKAATGALKYCLMRTFNVSEKGDEDPDAETPEAGKSGATRTTQTKVAGNGLATQKQKALIRDKLAQRGIAPDEMQGYLIQEFGINDTEKMTAKDASAVIDMLIGGEK